MQNNYSKWGVVGVDSKQLENWADRLLAEYEQSKRGLNSMKNELNSEIDYLVGDKEPHEIDMKSKSQIELNQQDKKQINSMISDMTFSIEWLRIGRRPGNMRGIDKRSAYQRKALIDMDLFPSLDLELEQRVLTEPEKRAIMNVLVDLSHRERQCYLLHMAHGLSMQEIADELGIKKPSVQKFILRAKNKISCHTNVIRTRIGDEKALI